MKGFGLGIHGAVLKAFSPLCRKGERILGETLASVATTCGRMAAQNLFNAQWSRKEGAEWFDGRLSYLYPDKWLGDISPVVHENIVGVLPLGGTLLDLAGGDGFLPCYVYSRRAKQIVSVDYDQGAHRHAVKHHSRPNIKYINGSILDLDLPPNSFDVVSIRGAIEHFSQENQQKIFRMALRVLKPGGWFCGDTPANKAGTAVLLSHHENEWEDEAQMRRELSLVFSDVHTKTYDSWERVGEDSIRHSLLWRCRKPA
jgi:ubiquinone/menaquinone biosynthesis C-methylase UbiE